MVQDWQFQVSAHMTASRSSSSDICSLVSVVILSYGDTQPLRSCLEAIANDSYPNKEIVIGRFGTDGIDEAMAGSGLATTVVRFESDVGVAAARNKLCESSNGEYLAFLDDDTIPTHSWLSEAIKVLSSSKEIGAVQSLLLDYTNPTKIEGAGSLIDISGYPLERGRLLGVLEGRTERSATATDLFGACSAAMVVKKEIFSKVGLFDPDFIIEMEDLDVSWRIRLAGYHVRLAEKSKVLHRRRSMRNPRSKQYQDSRSFNGLKNQILCIAKNMGSRSIVKYSPIILMSHIVKLFMPRGGVAPMATKAMFWNLRNLRLTLRKRYMIQHVLRRRPDSEILAYAIRLPILLTDILIGTSTTLRIVRSLDERQLHAAGGP
jgi:GT2 family glycosyltransferase